MEEALHSVSQVNARLKKLDQEKNEFLGVAAHDLKNPLSVVMGFAEMIAGGRNTSPERNRDDARYIISAAERMISLITQLLDVNAIEQGRFPLEIEIFDLGRISTQVTDSFAIPADKKGITIYAAGPLMPAWVNADPKATHRILDNLLSNAIKYSPSGSDVFVRMRNSPDGVIWEVQDQGPGLTAADQKKLFQKFTKLSVTADRGRILDGAGAIDREDAGRADAREHRMQEQTRGKGRRSRCDCRPLRRRRRMRRRWFCRRRFCRRSTDRKVRAKRLSRLRAD